MLHALLNLVFCLNTITRVNGFITSCPSKQQYQSSVMSDEDFELNGCKNASLQFSKSRHTFNFINMDYSEDSFISLACYHCNRYTDINWYFIPSSEPYPVELSSNLVYGSDEILSRTGSMVKGDEFCINDENTLYVVGYHENITGLYYCKSSHNQTELDFIWYHISAIIQDETSVYQPILPKKTIVAKSIDDAEIIKAQQRVEGKLANFRKRIRVPRAFHSMGITVRYENSESAEWTAWESPCGDDMVRDLRLQCIVEVGFQTIQRLKDNRNDRHMMMLYHAFYFGFRNLITDDENELMEIYQDRVVPIPKPIKYKVSIYCHNTFFKSTFLYKVLARSGSIKATVPCPTEDMSSMADSMKLQRMSELRTLLLGEDAIPTKFIARFLEVGMDNASFRCEGTNQSYFRCDAQKQDVIWNKDNSYIPPISSVIFDNDVYVDDKCVLQILKITSNTGGQYNCYLKNSLTGSWFRKPRLTYVVDTYVSKELLPSLREIKKSLAILGIYMSFLLLFWLFIVSDRLHANRSLRRTKRNRGRILFKLEKERYKGQIEQYVAEETEYANEAQ